VIAPALLRLAGRIGVACVAGAIVAVVGVQYARIVARNVALAHELHGVERDTVTLREKRSRQLREMRRLSDPHGAVPEIHDRLHLVGDKEAIIYLEPAHRDGR